MSEGASGCDICACLDAPLVMMPGDRAVVPTGISVEVPEGFELQVRPRSGLALKTGVTVLNAPGTIDSDYRGEIKVILVHLGGALNGKDGGGPVTIASGDRVAQLVLARVEKISWEKSSELATSKRGDGGFGSTGIKNESIAARDNPI